MIGYGGGNVLLPLSGSSDGGTTWVTNVSTLSDIKTFMFKSGEIEVNSAIVTTANIDSSANISVGNVSVLSNVEVAGNISANYFIGNGSQLTGLGLHYQDSDVANLLASFGSNVIETTGNITGGNVIVSTDIEATGNITGGNVIVSTDIEATGNISANNISITSLLQLPAIDNATRNGLDASVGQVVYSTDDDTIQVFLANSTWGNLALI
jgi:hypothetical protein